MKKTMKFLTMTALALTGAVMTGCSNDDEIQQPKDNVVTLKTTVSISGGEATTRALTTDGVKTFAAGEKIAVIYTNTSNETVKTVSDELPDGDYGKTATFTVTLTNPKAGGDVRYIYPAAMAATTMTTTTPVTDDATVNYAALNSQDGTMASLSANLDFAKFDGSLTASAGLPASPTLVNQLAICEFTINNAAGTDITNTLTSLTMANGGNSYTVSPSSLSKIYVAVKPVTEGDITFTATDNATFNYNRNQSGKTLAAGNLYPISFKMTKEKKDASVTPPTAVAATLTYSGSAQTLFSAGSTTGGTMKYKVTTTNDKPASTDGFTTTIDQGTNAGTYYLWYYVDGGDDYNTTEVNGTAVSKEIAKAAATLTCNNSAISFSESEATNSTKTKSASCTGGTINVTSANTGNCTVSYSSGTITVTRKTDSAFTNTQITVSVTPDGNHTAPSNVTFNVSAAAYYKPASSATSSDKGKLICTDGHIHAYGADAACTKARVAKIVYVGSDNGESAPYNHGLALALSDANGGVDCKWKTSQTDAGHTYKPTSSSFSSESGLQYNPTHKYDTYPAFKAAIANNGTAEPTGCSSWFLASGYQWVKMANAAGGYTALHDGFSSVGGSNLQSYYWSGTERDSNRAWYYDFPSGRWYDVSKTSGSIMVRACLAF